MSAAAGLPRLILLTDRSQLRLGRGLVRTVAECVSAGLTHVVVREHDLDPHARHGLITALAEIDDLTVISSRTDDPAAHGVHLAADGPCNAELLPLPESNDGAEEVITPRYIVGRSCHSAVEVKQAAGEGADYATLSPYAETASKPGYGPPIEPAELAGHEIPAFALGGITRDNAAAAREAGAYGVAVMGAVMRAADPAAEVAALLTAVGR
ncbi:thiamine phosphate synthase [Nocardioides speluncae]|uniref:thiamine phosphate synthase n=1 Tax=Nocardioides speluncae TaxID=2670337 RepID=UPI000D692CD1|nr:thiamine phosphate synthase [Nocardioides speluncae]